MADRDQDLITAMQAHRAGRLNDAYSAYIRALSKRPDNETARYHLGILEMQRGRTDDALRHLKTAAQLAPGNAAIQFDLGRALLQTGQLDPAAGIFEALSQRAGEHPEINYHLALVREKQGRLEEAERELQRALALQPDHLGALLHSGQLSLRRNDKTTAAARFESALEQSPANGDALVALAGLREEAGALDAAEDLLRRAIDVAAPDVPDAHVRLSRLLESKDQPEEALRVAQLATQHCPGHDIAWRQLGQLLKRQGHLQEAVAAFGRGHALLRDPGLSLGVMLETAGAALSVDRFLATADSVGFGLNDLMQSLFGADRDLPAAREHLDPYAPALYRFLRLTAELAAPGVNRVQLCGILPQLPGLLPVLLGLGYRTFSVDVAHAPYLARSVATRSSAADRGLAEAVCAAASSDAVADLLGVWHWGKR